MAEMTTFAPEGACRFDGAAFIARDPAHFAQLTRALKVPCCVAQNHVHPILRMWALPLDLRMWADPGVMEHVRGLMQRAPEPAAPMSPPPAMRLEPQLPIVCRHDVNVRLWRCPYCEAGR